MNEYIKKHFTNSIRTKESVLENEEILSTIEDIAMLCVDAIKKEKKIFKEKYSFHILNLNFLSKLTLIWEDLSYLQ